MATPAENSQRASNRTLPEWLGHIVDQYNSHSCNQFIFSGNIHDRFVQPGGRALVTLPELLMAEIIPRFDVVLSYDIGNGVRVERGAEVFGKWGEKPEASSKSPRAAIELITCYLRYVANLARLGASRVKVAVLLKDAQLFAADRLLDGETNALCFLVREWSRDPLLTGHDIISFILSEALADLHPLLRQNAHAAKIKVPLPDSSEIHQSLEKATESRSRALAGAGDLRRLSAALCGTTLTAIHNLLKVHEHRGEPLKEKDLLRTKSALVEQESGGLLEVLPPKLNLDALQGQDALKEHLRQNSSLWKQNRLELIPMGYLICGPVGTGKTFLVRCLAGEANVPVVVLKNFREKWYGSTESNLEKIFRTIGAIGQCYVFIDEADQTLGRRDSSGSEPGVSGRIYSMLAQEMSRKENRGRIVWILATSRPDLVEVDLKRPGRVDLKVPLFPAATRMEGFKLIQGMAANHQLSIPDDAFDELSELVPELLTPGEVEALLTDLRRELAVNNTRVLPALRHRFENYFPAVPREVLEQQIRLAVREASRKDFIPQAFRDF